MLMDLNGDPPLGQLYRHLDSRLERARFFGTHNDAIGSILHELKVRLDAWADIIDYRKEVLDAVERDGGELAVRTRKSFIDLHEAMEEFEIWLPQLTRFPNDRIVVARSLEAISRFRELLHSRLTNQTGPLKQFQWTAARKSARPVAPRSITMQPTTFNAAPEYPYSAGYLNGSHSAASPSHQQYPPTPVSMPASRTASVFVKSEPHPDIPHRSSRPSTAGSLSEASLPSYCAAPVTSFPTVSQILSGSELRQHQTPSTSSADSSPLTPSHDPYSHHTNTTTHHIDWDRPTLSPMKSYQVSHTTRLHLMEPRHYATSPLGVGPHSGPDSQWLGSYPRPRSTAFRHSGHF